MTRIDKRHTRINLDISAQARTFLRWGVAIVLCTMPAWSLPQAIAPPASIVSWQKQADGVTFQLQSGVLRVQVWTPHSIRVLYGPGALAQTRRSLSVISSPQRVPWRLVVTPQYVTLATGATQAQVDRSTSAVRFLDAQGKPILSETPDGRSLTPVPLAGTLPQSAYRSQQSFALPTDEDIYGLGQHRLPTSQGNMSYRGTTVTLEQANREVAIPFLTSSRGYGLLWDNPAHTDVSVGAGDSQTVPSSQLLTEDGQPGGLTARYYQGHNLSALITTRTDRQVDFNWAESPAAGLTHDYFSVKWTGSVLAQEAGDYTFVTTSDDGARLWVDDKQIIDDWSNHAARDDSATVHFAAHSRHKIRMEYFQDTRDAIARLAWRHGLPQNTVWTSEAADNIDYYFIEGPALDTVIAEYRALDGSGADAAKMGARVLAVQGAVPVRSRNGWTSRREYRGRRDPIDNLVQDFLYWEPYPVGIKRCSIPKRYPDPDVRRSHNYTTEYHLHFMISVWGKFYPGSCGKSGS